MLGTPLKCTVSFFWGRGGREWWVIVANIIVTSNEGAILACPEKVTVQEL